MEEKNNVSAVAINIILNKAKNSNSSVSRKPFKVSFTDKLFTAAYIGMHVNNSEVNSFRFYSCCCFFHGFTFSAIDYRNFLRQNNIFMKNSN